MTIGLFSGNVFPTSAAPGGGVLACFGGPGRQRVHLPAKYLARNGVDANAYVWMRSEPDGALSMTNDAHDAPWVTPDLVVLHAWFSPNVVERAVASGQRVIYDLDDDHLATPSQHADHGQLDPLTYSQALRAATAITVSTERLVTITEQFHKPTYLLRNAIDTDEQWKGIDELREPADTVRYAWVGDTRFRADDLGVLKQSGFWLFILRHIGKVSAVHVGDVPGARSFRQALKILWDEAATQLEVRPLVHISEYALQFARFDVCVIPLEDHPLNHAKSWLRGLECCAAGVPFCASEGFAEYQALASEGARFTTLGPAGFEALLDPDLRRDHAAHNREVARSWSMATRWPAWAEVYERVLAL